MNVPPDPDSVDWVDWVDLGDDAGKSSQLGSLDVSHMAVPAVPAVPAAPTLPLTPAAPTPSPVTPPPEIPTRDPTRILADRQKILHHLLEITDETNEANPWFRNLVVDVIRPDGTFTIRYGNTPLLITGEGVEYTLTGGNRAVVYFNDTLMSPGKKTMAQQSGLADTDAAIFKLFNMASCLMQAIVWPGLVAP